MILGLEGKVAVVTGASRGIGRAIADRLAAEGMKVAVCARTRDELRGDLVFPADLRDPDAPAHLVAAVIDEFGGIDVVVNNAGATRRGNFFDLTDDDWHDGFALKLHCAVRLAREAWPSLVIRRGCIVNIAGIGGRTGSEDFTIGGAVNAALLNLTKALADRGVKDRVRVNAVNPGTIVTDRLTQRIQRLAAAENLSTDDAAKKMTAARGIARFGRPDEIAAAVAFLASDQAAYINGAILDVDGGATRTL